MLVPRVLTGARQGPIVTYECAFNIKRVIFMSDRFQLQFSVEANLLRDMVQNTLWRFVDSPYEFQALKSTAKHNSLVLGLFTDVELSAAQGALPKNIHRHMFNTHTFLDFVRRVSLSRSNLGLGQL